jgi:hypothetical protein
MSPIVSQDAILRMYRDACQEMPEDRALLDVAGRTGHEPQVIESVLAARESLHNAMEVLA